MAPPDEVIGSLFGVVIVGLIVAYGFLRRRDVRREMEARRMNPGAFPPTPITTRLVVADVDIPFGRLVGIITKVALASIPAMLIVTIVVGFIWAVALAGLIGSRVSR